MSQYKVDGHIFSVDEFYTWIMGFIMLYRKGKLAHRNIPDGIHEIMKETDDKKAGKAMMVFLKENDEHMDPLIKMVQAGCAEMALDK